MQNGGYPSDLIDDDWAHIEAIFDPRRDGRSVGRPPEHPRRRMVDAVRYLVRTGIQWRYMPSDFPPWSAVWSQFRRWRIDGVWAVAMAVLRRAIRVMVDRDPEPSALLLDAQTVPSGRIGPREHVGIDGGKHINGRKRHLVCDVDGIPVDVDVGAGRPHDSRGGWDLLERVKSEIDRVMVVFADAGYESLVRRADTRLGVKVLIQKRQPGTVGFVPLKPLWRIERAFAWLCRNRRLRNDYEATTASSQACVQIAAVSFMLNRLR